MKPNKIALKIPEPCYENWNEMTTEEQGKFCAVCSKTVIDFSLMKDDELQNYFHENSDKKICGRFRNDQIDQNPFYIPINEFKKPMSFQRAFVLVLISVMGNNLFTSCIMGKPAKEERITQTDSVKEIDTSKVIMGKIDERHLDSLKKAGVKLPPPPVKQVEFKKPEGNPKIMGNAIPITTEDTLKK